MPYATLRTAWFYILLAGIIEILWPFILKYAPRYMQLSPKVTMLFPIFVAVLSSIPIISLLSRSMQSLPASTVYSTFVGIGVAGTAIIGMMFFHEEVNLGRVYSLVLIAMGVVGLGFFRL